MKHWKAPVTFIENGVTKNYVATVAALNQYEAVNAFKEKYGPDCLVGWIKETKLYGLQSAGY